MHCKTSQQEQHATLFETNFSKNTSVWGTVVSLLSSSREEADWESLPRCACEANSTATGEGAASPRQLPPKASKASSPAAPTVRSSQAGGPSETTLPSLGLYPAASASHVNHCANKMMAHEVINVPTWHHSVMLSKSINTETPKAVSGAAFHAPSENALQRCPTKTPPSTRNTSENISKPHLYADTPPSLQDDSARAQISFQVNVKSTNKIA
mmetsp:Transcript_92621/g.299548  ORF Transcript_92621/g.299548 Transcript_92621/m.299548 type:complete len:212 (+) Transcript_92621:250-885(+)